MTHHNGLTDFGKDVVREMNRLGMMVDISHVADKTFYDALAVSTAPLIASHSACRALANVPRNMTDEMIIALAKKGGVVQVNFYCNFLTNARSRRTRRSTMWWRISITSARSPASTPSASAVISMGSTAHRWGWKMSQSSRT